VGRGCCTCRCWGSAPTHRASALVAGIEAGHWGWESRSPITGVGRVGRRRMWLGRITVSWPSEASPGGRGRNRAISLRVSVCIVSTRACQPLASFRRGTSWSVNEIDGPRIDWRELRMAVGGVLKDSTNRDTRRPGSSACEEVSASSATSDRVRGDNDRGHGGDCFGRARRAVRGRGGTSCRSCSFCCSAPCSTSTRSSRSIWMKPTSRLLDAMRISSRCGSWTGTDAENSCSSTTFACVKSIPQSCNVQSGPRRTSPRRSPHRRGCSAPQRTGGTDPGSPRRGERCMPAR